MGSWIVIAGYASSIEKLFLKRIRLDQPEIVTTAEQGIFPENSGSGGASPGPTSGAGAGEFQNLVFSGLQAAIDDSGNAAVIFGVDDNSSAPAQTKFRMFGWRTGLEEPGFAAVADLEKSAVRTIQVIVNSAKIFINLTTTQASNVNYDPKCRQYYSAFNDVGMTTPFTLPMLLDGSSSSNCGAQQILRNSEEITFVFPDSSHGTHGLFRFINHPISAGSEIDWTTKFEYVISDVHSSSLMINEARLNLARGLDGVTLLGIAHPTRMSSILSLADGDVNLLNGYVNSSGMNILPIYFDRRVSQERVTAECSMLTPAPCSLNFKSTYATSHEAHPVTGSQLLTDLLVSKSGSLNSDYKFSLINLKNLTVHSSSSLPAWESATNPQIQLGISTRENLYGGDASLAGTSIIYWHSYDTPAATSQTTKIVVFKP
jgi:hypothetical protein